MKDRARFHWALWPYQVINVLREKWSRLIFSESIGSTQYIGRESARTDAEFRCWIRRNIFLKNVDRQVYLSVASDRLFFFKFYMMFYNWPKGRREGNPKLSNTIYSAPASIESIVYAVWPGDEGLFSYYCRCISSWVEMYVRWRRREKPIKGLINTHGSLVEHRVTGRPIYMVVRSAYSAAQLWQSCRAANR
jgi:hypothetical protein